MLRRVLPKTLAVLSRIFPTELMRGSIDLKQRSRKIAKISKGFLFVELGFDPAAEHFADFVAFVDAEFVLAHADEAQVFAEP